MQSNNQTYQSDINSGNRFEFGKNWKKYISTYTRDDINSAIESLKSMLRVNSIEGKSFLDIGSGSGLFSLAAKKIGANVTSFDYDPNSFNCTMHLKKEHYPNDPDWKIQEGSILDLEYVRSLGTYDIVYSWGVLHHTGDMWQALKNTDTLVNPGGTLFIALYNNQGIPSKYWSLIKRTYNRYKWARPILIAVHVFYPLLPSLLIKKIQGRQYPRGMKPWTDLIDWIGGYPFEVSTPEEIVDFFVNRNYVLNKIRTVRNRMGCNEFVFQKKVPPSIQDL